MGVTFRVIAWKNGIDHPVNVYERDGCDYVGRRLPNARLRDLLEQTTYNLTHELCDRMEWSIVQPKQTSFLK